MTHTKSLSKLATFLQILYKAIVCFFIVTFLWVLALKWISPPITFMMVKRKISAFLDGSSTKIHYTFVAYTKISANAKYAVMASEDQKFPFHHGFDFDAIEDAMAHNKKSKKKHGASTISQQVAKNVFLWDGRNFVRKGLEAYFTLLIELIWGKERILEVYLNVAEMGPMTFGIFEASKKYYKKSAQWLSAEEAASIAAVLPNPVLFKVKSPTKFILRRKAWIMVQIPVLKQKKYLSHISKT